MYKKYLISLTILIFLSGCKNNNYIACIYEMDDKSISLDINATNDDIDSIHVRANFEIPYKVILDKEKLEVLTNQLDDLYHFEDNVLIREYDIELDDIYSLDKTIEYLNSKRFHCE